MKSIYICPIKICAHACIYAGRVCVCVCVWFIANRIFVIFMDSLCILFQFISSQTLHKAFTVFFSLPLHLPACRPCLNIKAHTVAEFSIFFIKCIYIYINILTLHTHASNVIRTTMSCVAEVLQAPESRCQYYIGKHSAVVKTTDRRVGENER